MNEHCDMAARRAAELGFEPDHLRVHDESPLLHDALFTVVLNNAFDGRPELEEVGLRLCIMAGRCFVPVPILTSGERRRLGKIVVACYDGLRVPVSTDARRVFEMIMGTEVEPRRIGRRASLVAYALNRSVVIRKALPSMEVIGELWKLRADNPRAAVSAAMNKLRDEMERVGQLPPSFQFWFEKTPDARAAYAHAQQGNCNRAASEEDEDEDHEDDRKEDAEVIDGIPIKPEFAGMRPVQRRARLRALAEAAEMRRLEAVRMTNVMG